MPDWMETPALLGGPVIIGLVLIALPFVNGTGEKSWRRRPVAVLVVILTYLSLGMLTYLGQTAPWSPVMNAWKSAPIAKAEIAGRSPLELQGALTLQYMQCRNCHAIDGVGGQRGPDLSGVGAKLNKDQLVRQVIQGGGNMPAYGNNLTPDQVEALACYMVSLRPQNVPPSRNPASPAKPGSE